jgi:hypothetical protein
MHFAKSSRRANLIRHLHFGRLECSAECLAPQLSPYGELRCAGSSAGIDVQVQYKDSRRIFSNGDPARIERKPRLSAAHLAEKPEQESS